MAHQLHLMVNVHNYERRRIKFNQNRKKNHPNIYKYTSTF